MAPKERCSVVRIHWKIVVLGVGPILRSLDSDDDGNLSYEASNVSLTLARLQSFHGVATEEVDEDATKNVYSRNGRDKRRIKKACESPQCSCQCKVPYQVMVKICVPFGHWPRPHKMQYCGRYNQLDEEKGTMTLKVGLEFDTLVWDLLLLTGLYWNWTIKINDNDNKF